MKGFRTQHNEVIIIEANAITWTYSVVADITLVLHLLLSIIESSIIQSFLDRESSKLN